MAQHELRAKIIVSGQEDGSLSRLGSTLQGMAAELEGISNAAMDFLKDSVDTYRNYEDGILETRSVLQSTYGSVNQLNNDMEKIEKAAQHWAETTIFTTDDVANSIANAAHAGWDYEKIIAGMPSAMLIAQAGHLELADGVDYLTKMMAATGTSFEDSMGFVNEWSKAADLAATDIDEVGQAFLKLGTASRLAGSNEELFAFTSILANAGTTGSVAGTALRNVMARIAAPTKKAEEAMEALGLSEEEAADALADLDDSSTEAYERLQEMGFSAYDSEGNLRSFMDIISDMNIMLGDMDEKTKNDFLKQLFGTKSFAYAMTLLDAARDGSLTSIYEAILGVRDTDYAENKAATVMSGLTGSIEIMNSKWEEFKRKIGESFSPFLEGGIGALNGVIDSLNDMNPVVLDALTGAITTIAISAPALLTAGTAIKIIGAIGLGGSAFGWLALATGVTAATVALKSYYDEDFSSKFGSMDLDTDALNAYLNGLDDKFNSLATNATTFRTEFENALTGLEQASSSLSGNLLTDMITGTTLTEPDIENLLYLGGQMHDYLVAGIQSGTASSMAWYEALFSYGDKNPNASEAYNDLITLMGLEYDAAIASAESLGRQLGTAISTSVKDGIISGDEYATIAELMEQYNEAMAEYASAERAGEVNQMLHDAQNVSWDSYKDWATNAGKNYQQQIADLDSQYYYEYGKAESKYRSAIEKGRINPKTGQPYTEADWLAVSSEMESNYAAAKSDYSNGYTDAIMRATEATLRSGGMWEAFDFLQNYDGHLLSNEELAMFSGDSPLFNSFKELQGGFGEFMGVIGPFMEGVGIDSSQWLGWIDQIMMDANAWRERDELNEYREAEERANQTQYQEIITDEDWKKFSAFMNNPLGQDRSGANGSYFYDNGDGVPVLTQEQFSEFMNNPLGRDETGSRGTGLYDDSSNGVISFSDFIGNLFGSTAHAEGNVDLSQYSSVSGTDSEQVVSVTDNGSASGLESEIQSLFGSDITQDVNVTDNGSASSLRSSIASQFSSPITQSVIVSKSGGMQQFAEGGRATQASIFGEAGAEWAIPEEHTQRTAELLARAASASGFTWSELLSRNGGLNSGESRSTTIVYSPTINAGSTEGIEKVLRDDKERLDQWWRERNMIQANAAYA